MNKRKHYGKKIKKTRNLYRKKMSPGKKALGTAVFVLAVSGLVFLGFCIGKPLLDYLGDPDRNKQPDWTPAASYSESMQTRPPSDETLKEQTTEAPAAKEEKRSETAEAQPAEPEQEPQEAPEDLIVSLEAPVSALSNRASLSAVVAKAKAAGFNSVVLKLKDDQGYFRYKSGIEKIKDTKLIAGSMTLAEIVSVFEETDIKPIAEISVLSDHAACELFSGLNFKCIGSEISWLDYSTGVPTRWTNPESGEAAEYFASIAAELGGAGITELVLSNVVFPNFQSYDAAYIEKKYFAADRYKMLYNVVKAGNIIEMKAADVLADKYGRTAELLYDTSLMHDNSIALVISRSELSEDAGYPADAKVLTEFIMSEAAKKAGSVPIIPVIDSASFGDADTGRIVSALSELGYNNYMMR